MRCTGPIQSDLLGTLGAVTDQVTGLPWNFHSHSCGRFKPRSATLGDRHSKVYKMHRKHPSLQVQKLYSNHNIMVSACRLLRGCRKRAVRYFSFLFFCKIAFDALHHRLRISWVGCFRFFCCLFVPLVTQFPADT